ncbi:MAG: helix-turn-helix domain-containing protein [Paucibacter sp.]|nr:helix-turn-helix domain-containing protein [Roseateles sp.]
MSAASEFEDSPQGFAPDEGNAAIEPNSAPHRRDLVAGLEKGLMVIAAFDQERPRLTISEVAARTGLTRAAARRYLLTLTYLGFVSQDRKMFALTPRVLRLGQSYLHSARLPRIIEPELLSMSHQLKEASVAAVLDEHEVIAIVSSNAGRITSPLIQVGARLPAHCSATGRVLLAALPDHELERWLASRPLTALTPHTIVKREDVRQVVERVRAAGFATQDQEVELGLRSIAVPLLNHRGEVVAALNVCVQASRMSMEQLIDHGLPPLLQAQQHLRVLL